MKTTKATAWVAVCAAVLTAAASFPARADDAAIPAVEKNKVYTGTVASVDPQTHMLDVEGWTTLNKKFNFSDACVFLQLDKHNATSKDLRVGEKVNVSYQEVNGSAIASRVEQEAMRFEGTVKEADPKTNVLVLHQTALDKELLLPVDCQIMLHGGKRGTLADIEVGNHVTAIYETPNKIPVAREILKSSIPFTGTLTAVDATKQTVTARTMAVTKTFQVADDCVFAINGVTNGKLEDLKLNNKFVFSYDEIKGVETVSRIASAEAPPNAVAVATPAEDY